MSRTSSAVPLLATILALMLAGCAATGGDGSASGTEPPSTAAAVSTPASQPPPPPRTAAPSRNLAAPQAREPAASTTAAPEQAAETSAGARKLADGIAQYEAGDFSAAIRSLQASEIDAEPVESRIRAGKYLAFSYCVTQRRTLCRRTFDSVLRLDRDFTLSPVEAGHPLWGPVFAQARKAAAQPARSEAARARK